MRAKINKRALLAAAKAKSKLRQIRNPSNPTLGQDIFIYNHVQTNQVVYSLTRSLDNNAALRQLPYNGKKTKPAALRKDLWSPMAHVSLSSSSPSLTSAIGLKVFQKLREYRKLHETLWPKEWALWPKELGWSQQKGLSRVQRGRKLNDQKANSIADLAAALKGVQLEVESRDAVRERTIEAPKGRDLHAKREGEEIGTKSEGKEELEMPRVRATVMWKNILDAEYAESWPDMVVHGPWNTKWNNRGMWGDDMHTVESPVAEEREVEVETGGKVATTSLTADG